jgi:spermidine/putrescine transport system permease protein
MATVNTALCVLVGYPTAYFIARSGPTLKAVLLPLLILPLGTNFLIRAYAWIFILRTEGLLNSFMLSVGLQPLDLLFTRTSVITGLLYNYLPFMILPIYASLHRFDFALIAAAKDLGAAKFEAFKTITLPLSVPGLMAGILLVFVPSFGEFVVPDLLGGAKNIMLGNLIKMQFLEARNWPFGAAVTVVVTAIIFVVILMFRKLGADKSVIGV